MAVKRYSIVAHDWVNLEFIINDLTRRVVGQEVNPTSSPTFAEGTITGDMNIGGDLDIVGDLSLDGTLVLDGLTASQIVGTDAGKALVSIPVIGNGLTLSGGNLYWAWLGINELSESPDEDSMMVWNGPSAGVLWESGNTLNHTLGLGTEDSPTFAGLISTGIIDASEGEVLVEDNNTSEPGSKDDGYIGVSIVGGQPRIYFAVDGDMYYVEGAASAVITTGSPIGLLLVLTYNLE